MENNSASNEKISASARSLTRREWVQRMLAGAGAGIAAPTLAAARAGSAGVNMVPAAVPAAAESAAEWKPAFFDDYQNQLLIALAEKIVPGSTGVQSNRFLDTAMAAETLEVQHQFVASLNAIEGESLRRFTRPFTELSAAQQDEVLTAASAASPSDADSAAVSAGRGTPTPTSSLRDYFDFLKGWVGTAYYSTEVGMKELGWTGENFFTSFPGCEHAGGHS